ncbi:hypothetical protein [Halorientalis sp. IM1011]|uniref:hypothetical protein n=1 Tax=Halorientalis sp. IM1011 TaxID=1932360 RepID=UPI0020A5ECC1|nr:hypothetical protein [Halorientalis sp. IM1011]
MGTNSKRPDEHAKQANPKRGQGLTLPPYQAADNASSDSNYKCETHGMCRSWVGDARDTLVEDGDHDTIGDDSSTDVGVPVNSGSGVGILDESPKLVELSLGILIGCRYRA